MNTSNSWKTTSAGILTIAGAIVGFFFAWKANSINEAVVMGAVTAIVTGVGLIFSKDGNVTGGSVSNGKTPDTLPYSAPNDTTAGK